MDEAAIVHEHYDSICLYRYHYNDGQDWISHGEMGTCGKISTVALESLQ
jgi:hypothetical protein